MVRRAFWWFVLILALAAAGCGSGKETAQLSADERFEDAKRRFDNEDYLEAINEFTVITLQNQGSAHAGDAQFYIGQSRFRRNEYLLSAFEFGVLKRSYPASPHVPEAQYLIGLSYYMLSPKYSLDQQYTRKAIDELQAYVEYYPSGEHAHDAETKIAELTARLARQEYEIARQYVTLGSVRAAMFYFDDLITRYHDTEYAPLAYLAKVELLISRKRFQEARDEIQKFLTRYPNSVLRGRGEELKKSIDDELKSAKGSLANPPAGKESAVQGSAGNAVQPSQQ